MSLTSWLERFDRVPRNPHFEYDRSAHFDGGQHSRHMVIGSMIHGDEVGSLPAVVRVMEALAEGSLSFGGKVTFFVGNPEAGLEGVRFLESDLNRVFVEDPPDTHEGRRARLLRPILDEADAFLDLHQTILATRQPFYIFPFGVEGWFWARALAGAKVWVTRHPGVAFSSGTCCADEYVRLRGRPGMTLELGQRGFHPDAEERAYRAIVRALQLMDELASGESTLEDAAMAEPELQFYHTVHREPFATERHALREGLVNFEPISTGNELSAPGTPKMVCPQDGMILFPKYPPVIDGAYKKPLPKEIYRIVQVLPSHPTRLFAEALDDLS